MCLELFQEDISRLPEIENSLAIFCMATYGEGDPTDNAQELYEWLQNGEVELNGLKFSVSTHIRIIFIYPVTVDSLSRPRLSHITTYLEVEIWSLPKHENLTTGKKILWKRGEIAPKEQFLLFPQYF